ncbi:thioredoxin-like domain-containing protein [Podospora fimiseda]|uniref:protein disulfide-isomerase n=1 Tax=Podospora fimiseda TaxID=252190 RepID=A0AAN7BLJ1_9PEZI|nr:thioredoxin-like domain-containing protein [Podospora fimiseda]
MKILLGMLLVALAIPIRAWNHVSGEEELSRIVELEGRKVLVAFVKPDEPASAALEEEWTKVEESVENDDEEDNPVIHSIDCSSEGNICQLQQNMPDYFPSIWLLEKDKPLIEYLGARRADAILNFINRQSRPVVTELNSEEELNLFKTIDEVVFIAYLKAEDERGVFEDIASKYSAEFTFGIYLGSTEDGKQGEVKVYKKLDGDVVTKKGGVGDIQQFEDWVKEVSRGVMEELTSLNKDRLIERGSPIVYLFGETETQRQKLRKTLYKFARDLYDSITTVIVNPFDFPKLMGSLGLEPDKFPAGAVHWLSKDEIYPYPKEKAFTRENVQSWGMNIYKGIIKAWNKKDGGEEAKTRKVATRKISGIPGVNIKIAGRDEL